MRKLLVFSIMLMFASAVALYGISYETRRISDDVAAHENALVQAQRDLAILRAEKAHLTRPDRIAPLAQALGLKPATSHQFVDPARFTGADSRAPRQPK